MSLYPLPNLILLSDYQGNWEIYCDAIYQEFLKKVVYKITFLGLPVKCKYLQPINNMHRSFWHIITENKYNSLKDEDRVPDFRRCERIGWISHIINNANDNNIKCWQNERYGNKNVVLWLESESYMIVLSKRKDYYLLTTAYINDEITRRKNLNEIRYCIDPRIAGNAFDRI